MLLREIKIQNFRSLKDVSILLNKETVLIGENNSGKTSVLDAIRFALSKTSSYRNSFDEYDYYMDKKVLSPQESEGISIILRFEESNENEWPDEVIHQMGEVLQVIDNDSRYSVIIRVSSVFNKVTGDYEYKTVFLNFKNEELKTNQNKVNAFFKYVQVFYLQALRDIKDTFSSKSALWGRFLKKVSIPESELIVIQNKIEELNNSIISSDKDLSELVTSLKRIQQIMNFNGTDTVSINAMPLKSWDLLSKAQIVMNNDANSLALPLDRHGQGTQSVTTILLFRAYIELLVNISQNRGTTAILTLEEPEAHLHPQAIRTLAKSLSEIDCQKIFTTHSPYFIQNTDLKDIRFLRKKDGKTEIRQLLTEIRFKPKEIPDVFRKVVEHYPDVFSISNDKEIIIKKSIDKAASSFLGAFKKIGIDVSSYIDKSMLIFSNEELNNLNTYVKKSRGDILFGRKWLLYEGQSEDVVIPYFANLLGKNLDEHGVSTILFRSNGTAKSFIKLAKVLDIDWYLLSDSDLQKDKTEKEILGCGIEKNEFSRRVFCTTTKDFEHELASQASIFSDYEKIVKTELDKELRKKNTDCNEYSEIVIQLIQKSKVDSAYALVSSWEKRKFEIEEIPKLFKDLIYRVCE